MTRHVLKTFQDKIHGFTALSSTKRMAWMMIRGKCHENSLQVPRIDEVFEIKETIEDDRQTKD